MRFPSPGMFLHLHGAHSLHEFKEHWAMHSAELLPQFPHHDSPARHAAHALTAQEAGTQPCSSSSFNQDQHLASPAPSSHPCPLLLPPGTSFALQLLISIPARHTCGQQLALSQEGPGSAAKSSSPDESPAIRSVPCHQRAASPLARPASHHPGYGCQQLLLKEELHPVGCAQPGLVSLWKKGIQRLGSF